MYVSEAIWEDIKDRSKITSEDNWENNDFDKNGNLKLRIY